MPGVSPLLILVTYRFIIDKNKQIFVATNVFKIQIVKIYLIKLLPFLLLILMCAKSLYAQTVIDVQLPVKMGDDIGASSNDHSTYSWGQETNNLQGVNIFLASATTPYKPTIDIKQSL